MSVWRDMVIDGGLHIDAGCTIDEAAAWVEAQERAEWEKRQAAQQWEEAEWEKHQVTLTGTEEE